MKKWKKLRSEFVADLKIFKARFDFLINPRNQKEVKVSVLDAQDAVNIAAFTADQKVLLVKQYRFGSEELSMEFPGGFVDEGEDLLAAAKRELKEETGYSSNNWTYVGWVYANPVFMNSKIHHYVADHIQQDGETDFDDEEDIEHLLLSVKEMKQAVLRNEITHPHTIAALTKLELLKTSPHK